jgi:cellulose synthase/poly-beta-1,6-N-acetylglucosamine synthase-like glycosyltransferase
MITYVITAFKEPKTIGRAIEAFLGQGIKNYELIISAPDKETLDVAREYQKKNKNIRLIKDKGKGKPAALNLIFKMAKGNIIVLSDGDVFISSSSVKKLIGHFNDSKIGGVSGKVVSCNDKGNMFGFWAHLLSLGFHYSRIRDVKNEKNVVCSGYLYAIRNGIVKEIPEKILADDAFISLSINKNGYKTGYEPEAKVYVKYPDNLPDWIRQKKRTAGRYYQLSKEFKFNSISSFGDEIVSGIKTFREVNSFKRVFWFLFLGVMRIYIWFRVFFDFRLWNREFNKTWERVESTK